MPAASVIVEFLAKTGSFVTDTDRAGKALSKLKKEAADAGKTIGDNIAKLGALTLGAGTLAGFTALVKNTIDAADHLNDLSKKSGVAVETLGGIGFAAGQAGGDLESATAGFIKLDKAIAAAIGGNEDAQKSFAAIGISLQDLKTKSPDEILAKTADAFAQYEDGAEKTALAVRIFGKAGADMIPLLNDGGKALQDNIAYFKQYSGVSADTAAKADEFNDTLGKLKLLGGAFAQTLTAELLPTLQSLANLWLENKEKGTGFRDAATTIADAFRQIVGGAGAAIIGVTGFAKALGGLLLVAQKVGERKFVEAFDVSKEVVSDFKNAASSAANFYDAVVNGEKKAAQAAQDNYSNEGRNFKQKKQRAPVIADGKAAADASASLKKQLDGQIKLIQDAAKAQADAIAFSNELDASLYAQGLLKQSDYFADQKKLRDDALRNQLDAIDKEIAAEQAFINNPASKPADRIAAEEKIKLARQQRSEAVLKASREEILAENANKLAVEQLGDAYDQFRANVLQASGDDAGAALIRNAQNVKRARDLITQQGGDASLADVYAQQLKNATEAAKIQKDYNNLLSQTRDIEQNILLDAQKNGAGELETLAKIRDARTAAIQQLREQAAAAAQLAAVSGTDQHKQRAADLATAVKNAESQIDPLAQKINSDLSTAFTEPFKDFVKGTDSALEAANHFFDNLARMALDLAAKDIASSIFGTNNGQSGAGGFLSGLFGSGSSGGSSGGSLVSTLASFFGGFFAAGGMPPVGKASIVGENGPELFVPRTAGTILPNDFKGTTNQRTTVNNISVSPPAGTSRQDAMQIGADIARQLAVADRRNN